MKPSVYILYSRASNKYYIGSTANIENRLKHHLGGYTPSTQKMAGLILKFNQEYDSLKQARDIEKRLKKLKRRDYIEKIIRDGAIHMHV